MKSSSPIFGLLMFSLFISLKALAQESGTARVSVRDLSYLASPPSPVERSEVSFTTDYDRRYDLGRKFSFQFHPYLYGTTLKETRQQQVVFDPRSLSLAYEPGPFWMKLGYFTMKWEGTDGLNPMDIASMTDWSDPLLTESRASAGLQVGKSGDKYDFELAYIPYQTLWLLPGVKSAWLPRRFSFPLRTSAVEIRLPDHVEYQFHEPNELNNARRNNVATRLQVRGDWGDIAVAFYDGLSGSPALEPLLNGTFVQTSPTTIIQVTGPIELTPIAYRVRTVSGFASHAFDQWIVRASTRYDQPEGDDSHLPGWSQYSVVGVERSFEFIGNTATTILQGAWVRAPESRTLASVQDVIDRALLVGIRYPMGEKWTSMISGFISSRNAQYYAKTELGYRYSDHWRLDGALEVLDGPPDSLLGVFGANDRAFLTLSGVY